MRVLVDTCIWSHVLRRKHLNNVHVVELKELIGENRVHLIGPIRQEILSGVNDEKQFERLRSNLSAFPDLLIKSSDYEKAAEFCNIARKKGIQGSTTDYLICAIAHKYSMQIYTVDRDFERYKKYLPIHLYVMRSDANNLT